MKYYLIAGEASGDLHASHLMRALRAKDPQATFRFFGGDLMAEVGGTLVAHYRDLAYMGFVQVVLHARTILKGLNTCKQDILQWQADVVILVDYPGFNLKIAQYIKQHSHIPVFYYISPKIWAWKEGRIRQIKRYVDQLFSILPFEVDFFEKKHHYPIHYVGNPSLDEVYDFCRQHTAHFSHFCQAHHLPERPIIALLAGSRKQEIKDNLTRMLRATQRWEGTYQRIVAMAPGIDEEFYHQCIGTQHVTLLKGATFALLQHSTAALVTSGTATLETALFGVPQVVCYYMKAGWLANVGKKLLLHVPYISLVNLIAGREIVPELIGGEMNAKKIEESLAAILPGGHLREQQLKGYQLVHKQLGEPGAPQRAAARMIQILTL